jgi:hypothetical protein
MGTGLSPVNLRPVVKEREDAAAKLKARLARTCTGEKAVHPLTPDVEFCAGSGPTRCYTDIHHASSQRRHGELNYGEDDGDNLGASTQGEH